MPKTKSCPTTDLAQHLHTSLFASSTLVRREPSPPVTPVLDGSASNAGQLGQPSKDIEEHSALESAATTRADAPVHAVASAPNKAARNNGHLRQQEQHDADQH